MTAPLLAPAYDAFVAAHRGRLERLVRRRLGGSSGLGSAAEAEELVQEVLLRAHAHWHELASEDSAAAWTTTVATRLVLDRLRSGGRSVPVAQVDEHVRTVPDTADVVVLREAARCALDSLEALPTRQAAVLWAREVEGLSYDAIGERLGLSEPSVRSLLSRGRKGLRTEYARRGGTLPGVTGALALLPLAPALDALRALGRLQRSLLAKGAAASGSALAGLAALAVVTGVLGTVTATRPDVAVPVPVPAARVLEAPAAGAAPVPAAPRGAGPAAAPAAPAAPRAPQGAARTGGGPAALPGACLATACLDGTVTQEDRDRALVVPVPSNPARLEEAGVVLEPDPLPVPPVPLVPLVVPGGPR